MKLRAGNDGLGTASVSSPTKARANPYRILATGGYATTTRHNQLIRHQLIEPKRKCGLAVTTGA